MVRVIKVMGPLGDKNLTHLHRLLSGVLPGGDIDGLPSGCGRGDIPDMMMGGILGDIMPPGMIPGLEEIQGMGMGTGLGDRQGMGMGLGERQGMGFGLGGRQGGMPGGRTKVTILPNGISIQSVRSMHKDIGPRILGGGGMHRGLESLQQMLGGMDYQNPHMLTGDDFPVHADPLESMLSLLYAKAQEGHMDKDVVEGVVRGVKEDLGNDVTEKILAFIDAAKDGKISVKDGEKTIKVTISHDDGGEANALAVSEVSDKIAGLSGNYLGLTDLEKKAAFRAYDKHFVSSAGLRKVGLTQTDLVALKGTIDTMRSMLDDNGDLEALSGAVKGKIQQGECVTMNDGNMQQSLHDALVKILDEDPESGTVHDMVYNTDLPSDQDTIINIDGYAVDRTKLHSMTKREATSKYTPSLANYIYDDEKHAITAEKIREFLKLIASVEVKDPDLAELFKSRLVVPLFADLEPDADVLHEGTIVDED